MGTGGYSRRCGRSCRPGQPASREARTQPASIPAENTGLSCLKLPPASESNQVRLILKKHRNTRQGLEKCLLLLTHPETPTFGVLFQRNTKRVGRQHFGHEEIHPSVICNSEDLPPKRLRQKQAIKQRQGAQADSGRVRGDRDPKTLGTGRQSWSRIPQGTVTCVRSTGTLLEKSKSLPLGPQSLTTHLPHQPPTPLCSGKVAGSQRTPSSGPEEN